MQPCTVVARDGRSTAYASSMQQLAFVFPGQGSQSVGMGRTLADGSPAAAAVFAAADPALGEPISDARLGRAGRAARPDRERPAGDPGHLDRDPRSAPRALGSRRSRRPRAGLRGRPFDGPVLGPRRGRRARSRRRHPARARTRPPDAGVRAGSRRGDGRAHRTRRRAPPRAGRRRLDSTASSSSPTATRPGQVVVSGERAGDRGRGGARQVARREARHRAAGLRRGPLPAHGRGGRRDAGGPRRRRVRAIPPSRSWPTPMPVRSTTAEACRDRARRAPHGRGRLDPRRRADDRGRRDDLRRGRPGSRPDRPDQAHRPGRRGHRRRRPSVASTDSSPSPAFPPDHHQRRTHLAQARLRPPRRRHRSRGHQLRSATTPRPPGPAWSTACRASAPITRFDTTPYEAKLGRRGPRLRRRPTGWTRRPSGGARRACISASRRRSRRSPIRASR